MEKNKKIIIDGINAANCNFEISKVKENTIDLLNPEDYPAQQRLLIEEVNQKLWEANEKCRMAQLREEMFAKGFEAGMYIARFDEAGNQVSFEFSDETRRMLGYDGLDDLPNEFESWIKVLIPEERDTIVKLYWDAVKRQRELPEISHAEYRMRKKNGSIIWVTGAGMFVRRADGSLETYMGCYRDVTAEHEKSEHIHTLAEYSRVMSSTGFGMWHVFLKDGVAHRMQVNDKMAELLGVQGKALNEEELYQFWHDRIVPESLSSVLASAERMKSGQFSEITYQWVHPTKGVIYVRSGGTAEKSEDGTVALSGYHGDITDIVLEEKRRKDEIKELEESVYIDALTGANNRSAMEKYLTDCFENGKNDFYVAMLDIDHFKTINDTYGHQAGDRALQLLTEAFKSNLTPETFFARYGGDEFLLVSMSKDSERIKSLIERAEKSLKDLCLQSNIEFVMDFSCGIVQKTGELKTITDLLKAADAKMYMEKKSRQMARTDAGVFTT